MRVNLKHDCIRIGHHLDVVYEDTRKIESNFEKSRLIARVLVIATQRVASHEIICISHKYFLIRDYNRLRQSCLYCYFFQ